MLCSLHVVYCFQLERFLCRDCGKVKCACEDAAANADSAEPTAAENKPTQSIDDKLNDTDLVEHRNPKTFTRQHSGPENSTPKKSQFSNRASETPFVRSPQGENGKLRRSFAVRSREGLENLLSFASFKKGNDQGKSKQLNI